MSRRKSLEILGLKEDVSETDIKKAFKKLAAQYHPDKNPGNKESEQKFKEINAAYQFLTDPKKESSVLEEEHFNVGFQNPFDFFRRAAGAGFNVNFGSNEEAVYSPDGEFIVFTSKRVLSKTKAVQEIYIMNRDGEILGQLTQNFGRCYSPQWTNILK